MSARGFASDNHSGVHPDVLAAIAAANDGHVPAYGADPLDRRRSESASASTSASGPRPSRSSTAPPPTSSACSAACRPFEAVICPATAHLNVDECGAPEKIAGVKLIALPSPPTASSPRSCSSASVAWSRVGDEHASQPRLVSISNSTELGTVYTVGELRGARRVRARPRPPPPRRRRPPRQRRRRPGRLPARGHHRRRRRPALLRRHQERPPPRRGGRLPARGPGGGLRIHPQAGPPARLQDALPQRPARRPAQRRPLAPQRLARELDGAAAGREDHRAARGASWPSRWRRTGSSPASRRPRSSGSSSGPDGSRSFYVWDEAERVVRLMCSWDTTEDDVREFAATLASIDVT